MSAEEPNKMFCRSCRERLVPVFLKKIEGLSARGKDYSDVPLCPRCRNEWIWRNVPQMSDE